MDLFIIVCKGLRGPLNAADGGGLSLSLAGFVVDEDYLRDEQQLVTREE